MISPLKAHAVPSPGLASSSQNSTLVATLWVVAACLGVLATLFLPGCADPSHAHAVDVPHARDAVKFALDAWKKGETPTSLASSSMPMTVQDLEWASGAKLVDYQLLDDGKPEDANLRIQAKLSLSDAKGKAKTIDKKVWYLVGTSPQLTVFRDMLRR